MRAMKDSGIEWIGQIPQEWKTIRLRSQFSFGKGLPITKADLTESGVAVISYGQIHSKANTGTTIKTELIRYVDPKYLTTNESSVVTNGDFIFADTSEDISGCGNCVYVDVDYPLFAGYHTMILRPENETSTKYYSYLFATDAWRSQIRAQASGVKLFSITQKMLRDTLLVEPSEEEKDRIVRYLDDKCAAIDELIAAKEKTNALLKERRQSIIYEAVTKGLNPDAPMKDSGIEWIGQIPGNWTTWRMKHLASEPLQYGANATGVEFREDIPRYVRITDITADRKLSNDGKQSLETDIAQDYMLEDGDILFARSGATSGKSFYYEDKYGPCCFAGYLIKLRTDNRKALSKFLYYYTLTQAYENWTQQIFIQATIQNISADKYNNLWFAIPGSLEEQVDIVAYLDQRCSEMDELISANEATIQKLKEYRQSIIYEAVTGKVEL